MGMQWWSKLHDSRKRRGGIVPPKDAQAGEFVGQLRPGRAAQVQEGSEERAHLRVIDRHRNRQLLVGDARLESPAWCGEQHVGVMEPTAQKRS